MRELFPSLAAGRWTLWGEGPCVTREVEILDLIAVLQKMGAIISRELGIPCIVGTGDATSPLLMAAIVWHLCR